MQTKTPTSPQDDFFTLKDLWMLCLSKWYWFVLSFVVCFAIASAYLFFKQPVFTRSTSLLIKENTGSGSLSNDIASTFSELGMSNVRSNVDNEMINLKSTSLWYEVVKRLQLNVTYKSPGPVRMRLLYGHSLPIVVNFVDVEEDKGASLTIEPKSQDEVVLTDFKKKGVKLDGDDVTAKVGTTVKTPLGLLTITRNPNSYAKLDDAPIYVSHADMFSTIGSYISRLDVRYAEEGTTIIKLSFTDPIVARAEDVLNTLVDVYDERWINDKNQIVSATDEFINERLKILQNELGDIDDNITSSKSAHKLPDPISSAGIDMQQSVNEQQKIVQLSTQQKIASDLRAYINSAQNKLLPANVGLEDQGVQSLIKEYNELQLQRDRLVANSSDENVLVKEIDPQLASLKSSILNTLNNYLAAIRIQLNASKDALARADARISSIPVQVGDLLSPERQQKVKEALYLYLLQKREENQLSQAFTNTNSQVIDTPKFSGSRFPTSPVRSRVLLIALIASLLIPMAILFVREILNTKVRGRRDMEHMQTPFVGEIPEVVKKSDKKKWYQFFKRKEIKKKDEPKISVKPNSRNLINEAFRVIRTNLEFILNKEQKSHVIMITSANPGSGKTYISANLSTAMAIKGSRVLVVDLDLRKKSLGAYFKQPRYGVADYLSGKQNDYRSLIVSQEVAGTSLDILAVGTMPPNPAELLADSKLDRMIEELRNDYDIIFLDCPPIEIVTDADIINRVADVTLFVVRAGLLDRSLLPEIDNFYTSQKYKNIAVILNGTDGGSHYGYKYGYKYGYGSKYGYGYAYGSYGYGNHYGYHHEEE